MKYFVSFFLVLLCYFSKANFDAPVEIISKQNIEKYILVDVNNDLFEDLIVQVTYPKIEILYYENDKNGGFLAPFNIDLPIGVDGKVGEYSYNNKIIFGHGDINNDGYPEFTVEEFLVTYTPTNGFVFTKTAALNNWHYDVHFFDLDKDNYQDMLVLVNQKLLVYKNDGFGLFEIKDSVNVYGADFDSFIDYVGDYNNNGLADVIVNGGNNWHNLMFVEVSSTAFDFKMIDPTMPDKASPYYDDLIKLDYLDLNADKKLDVVTGDKYIFMLQQDVKGDYVINDSIMIAEGDSVYDVKMYDFDNDCDLEVLAYYSKRWTSTTDTITLFKKDITGKWELQQYFLLPHVYESKFKLFDIDNDGNLEVIFHTNEGVQMLKNNTTNAKCTTNGINIAEDKISSAYIYPNPSSSEFTVQISLEANTSYNISFYSLLGQKVYSCALNQASFTIPTEIIGKGVFVPIIQNEKTGAIVNLSPLISE